MKTYKRGISLIVLVVTVIVLSILASTVIISLNNTNIIEEARESTIKTRFQTMQEQLALYIADQYAVTNGMFEIEDLDAAAKTTTIDQIFPELKDTEYYDYVSLVNGEIVLAEEMPDREIAIEIIGENGVDEEVEAAEVITNYTQEDIDSSNGKLVAIGATDPLYVIAAFSDDGTTVTITKNGANSDGIIADYGFDENTGHLTSPLADGSFTTAIIKNGVVNIGGALLASFDSDSVLSEITIPNTVTTIGDFIFLIASNTYYAITDINYDGTMEEWNEINFAENWDLGNGSYTVHCTDGEIIV